MSTSKTKLDKTTAFKAFDDAKIVQAYQGCVRTLQKQKREHGSVLKSRDDYEVLMEGTSNPTQGVVAAERKAIKTLFPSLSKKERGNFVGTPSKELSNYRNLLREYMSDKAPREYNIVETLKGIFDKTYNEKLIPQQSVDDFFTPDKKRQKRNTSSRDQSKERSWQEKMGYAAAGVALMTLPELMFQENGIKSPEEQAEEKQNGNKLTFKKVLKTTAYVVSFAAGSYLLFNAFSPKGGWAARQNSNGAGQQPSSKSR